MTIIEHILEGLTAQLKPKSPLKDFEQILPAQMIKKPKNYS